MMAAFAWLGLLGATQHHRADPALIGISVALFDASIATAAAACPGHDTQRQNCSRQASSAAAAAAAATAAAAAGDDRTGGCKAQEQQRQQQPPTRKFKRDGAAAAR